MRAIAVPLALATGCTAVFGLTPPVSTNRDGGAVDANEMRDGSDGSQPADVANDANPDALGCSAEFVAIAGQTSRYFFGSMNKPWATAEQDCETRGGHLVVIGNETERTAVHNFNGTVLWIGLSDLATADTFVWVTGEDTGGYPPATGTPWASDPKSTAGDCVALSGAGGTFGNLDCGNNRNYMCECDGYAADPAHF